MMLTLLLATLATARCGSEANPLAAYEGERPLTFLRVTQSFTPQIQWVGGRVAAVGVNRGTRAALDSTLVWMTRAEGNTIPSFVTVGDPGQTDADAVARYGGTAEDRLAHGGTYTFWMAERAVLDADLDSTAFDGVNFADTTLTLDLLLAGRALGGVDVDIVVGREETLEGTRYLVQWTPGDVLFRQVGITEGRVGSFTGLVWHAVVPDGAEGGFASPVEIGQAPPGTDEIVAWSGFEPATYILWMTTADWDGAFGPRSDGYAYFQIFPSNFEESGGSDDD